jgi:FKBP-type peptidyl-prolyl cis-trans isomerase 2
MPISKKDQIKIHYDAKLQDGTLIESTRDKEPPSFKVGTQTILPGLEEGLIGLNQGDKKEIMVPPKKGFGERNEELLQEVPDSMFKEKPSKGTTIKLESKDGSQRFATVHEVKVNSIVLDHNHPLAGQTLRFDVEIIDIERSPH